jgi:hypothetical protein
MSMVRAHLDRMGCPSARRPAGSSNVPDIPQSAVVPRNRARPSRNCR